RHSHLSLGPQVDVVWETSRPNIDSDCYGLLWLELEGEEGARDGNAALEGDGQGQVRHDRTRLRIDGEDVKRWGPGHRPLEEVAVIGSVQRRDALGGAEGEQRVAYRRQRPCPEVHFHQR